MAFTLKFVKNIFFFVCCVNGATISSQEETELVVVSVIFRHGARTTYAFYPTDPNINETFYPIGLGGLTNEGKLGEYKLGRYLRNLYGNFVGEDYTEDKVYVRSTDVLRTKMSAQLVLAGLFPPSQIQIWNNELLWQPIPVSYKTHEEEDIFHPTTACPYKLNVVSRLPELPEIQDVYIKPHKEIYQYIQENSGKVMSHPADMQDFFFIIKTESDMNLTVPEWTKNVFPEPVHSIASQVYSYRNYDPRVRQINSGYMLKKILDDSKAKIEGTLSKKIFLYSGHETTLGYMLDALAVQEPHVPPYGSAISFEIHRGISGRYYIKLRYRNDTEALEPIDLKVPGCDVLCPLEQFEDLQKDLLPTMDIKDACRIDTEDAGSEDNYNRLN